MADEQSITGKSLEKPKSLETHFIRVPQLRGVVFVVNSNPELINGRWVYEMARPPVGRTVSFAKGLLHRDELDGPNYTYFSDGVVSNWDWAKLKSNSERIY